MTATQTFKTYQILNRYFGNEEKGVIAVNEIEKILGSKKVQRKEVLTTKENVSLLRQDVLKSQVEAEKRQKPHNPLGGKYKHCSYRFDNCFY